MNIMKRIEKTIERLEVKDKIRFLVIVALLVDYFKSISKNGPVVYIDVLGKDYDDKVIDDKYKECLEHIKILNDLSDMTLGEMIYEKEYTRKEVEIFLYQLTMEVCKNRK